MGDSLKDTLASLAKKYGTPVVFRGSEVENVRKIPCKIPMIDYVLTGGVLVNRVTELYGGFSSLKSYLCYTAAGQFQKYDWGNNTPDVIVKVTTKIEKSKGKDASLETFTYASIDKVITKRGYKPVNPVEVRRVALVDFEGTYDRGWGERLGIDNDLLLHVKPDSLNKGLDIVEALLSDPEVSLVIIDSMLALGSDAEVDASMENEQMAVNARFWNKATRKINAAMNRNPNKGITLMAINSSYSKVGAVFGDPEKLANGERFSLAKSCSIKMVALKEVKAKNDKGENIVGRNIKCSNKKNKNGVPFLEGTFYYSFVDDGEIQKGKTDVVTQIIELGLKFDLIDRKGNYYTYKEVRSIGMDKFRTALSEFPNAYNELYKLVYEKLTM